MHGGFSPYDPSRPRRCVVCEQPLGVHVPMTPGPGAAASPPALYALCPAFECRTLFQQALVAAAGADFPRYLQWRAKAGREMRVRGRLLQEKKQAEAREAAAVFAAIETRAGPAGPADLELVVPSGHARLRPVSQRRRRAYAAHLDTIIAGALQAAEPSAGPAPAPSAEARPSGEVEPGKGEVVSSLPARLCGACGGGCCTAGGERAYLAPMTIRRVLAANPGMDAAQLRATYLAHVPERTIPYSCINHTRGGCSLPKALRADTCNDFLCTQLERLQIGLNATPPVRTARVLRRRHSLWRQSELGLNNDIIEATVLTEGATTRLRLPARGD